MTHFKFTAELGRKVLILSRSTRLGQEETGGMCCKALIFLANTVHLRHKSIREFNGSSPHLQQLVRQLEFCTATALANGTWQRRAPAPNSSVGDVVSDVTPLCTVVPVVPVDPGQDHYIAGAVTSGRTYP